MALLPIWIGSKRALANRKKRLQVYNFVPLRPTPSMNPWWLFQDIADGKTGDDLDDIEVISSKEAAKFPIMASITLFSIYLLYKYFADKMYYFVTGYFFLLGVAAVTGTCILHLHNGNNSFILAIFEPLLAPRLKFIFPGLCEDAEYQLTFKENKKNQFDLIFSRRSLLVVACAAACGGAYLYNQHWLANNIIGLCFAIQVSFCQCSPLTIFSRNLLLYSRVLKCFLFQTTKLAACF